MLKMIIKFDEDKIRSESEYEPDEIYDYIDDLVRRKNLKVCDKGIYANNEEDDTGKALFSFMKVASFLAGCEWISYANEWLWYEDTEDAEDLLETFEVR